MGAKKNNFWTRRTKHGRDKLFCDPAVLLEAVSEYFEHVDANPWYKNELVRGGNSAGTIVQIPMPLPYTLKGICHFLDIEYTTWQDYKERPEFKSTVQRIEDFVYDHKYSGAAVGAFNANIIARDLGLVDKKEVESETFGKGFFALLKEKQTVNEEKPEL